MFLSLTLGIKTRRESLLITDRSKKATRGKYIDWLTFWQPIKHKKTNGTSYN